MGIADIFKGFSPEKQNIEERKKELAKEGPVSFIVRADGKDRSFSTRDEAIAFAQEQEQAEAVVKIAGIELEMWLGESGSQYTSKDFENFALDQNAMELITIMAKSIKLNQPPLIEGETDIGKSRSLEYLAYLTNHHLIYQSFSGQTDVTELIGKYVPRVSGDIPVSARKKIQSQIEEFLELLQANSDPKNEQKQEGKKKGGAKELSKDSQRIVKLARAEERGLNENEMREIAAYEGYRFDDLNWEWQDGTVPRAMEANDGAGCWLYFDEMGAAEPQILVKLNRIMATEGMRRFEITENGGREVSGGPHFRLIASTNPPKYAGRIPFEKDFLRRWNYQKAKSLTEEDSLQRDLARELGEAPVVKKEIYHVGRKKESVIEDFAESEETKKIYRELAMLHTKFLFAARNLIEVQPVEHGEQQFRFEESDKIRAVQYLKTLQQPDLVGTLREAIEYYYAGKIDPEKIITTNDGNQTLRQTLMDLFDRTAELLKTRENIDELVEAMSVEGDDEEEVGISRADVMVDVSHLDNIDDKDREELEELLGDLVD